MTRKSRDKFRDLQWPRSHNRSCAQVPREVVFHGLGHQATAQTSADHRVERVARGRIGQPNGLEPVWLASEQDSFGDAEQVLGNHLRDPRVDKRDKAHLRALLLAVEDSGEPRDLHACSAGG